MGRKTWSLREDERTREETDSHLERVFGFVLVSGDRGEGGYLRKFELRSSMTMQEKLGLECPPPSYLLAVVGRWEFIVTGKPIGRFGRLQPHLRATGFP